MSETNFDSINVECDNKKSHNRQIEWDMAIGLQQVDNLNPSSYLEELSEENINGYKTIIEVQEKLKKYYTVDNNLNYEEMECDFVSTRIVELLQNDDFNLSIDYLKYIHKYLFQDIYKFAGSFRNVNLSKEEKILNGDSVVYCDFNTIEKSLEYDFSIEKVKDYKNMDINNIADFSSRIWQVHPFREGNTRTTALFICKYLINLGYTVDKSLFKDKSKYFRNALVRSNYFDNKLNIKEDNSYLIKFYENLLLGKNNNFDTDDFVVKKII